MSLSVGSVTVDCDDVAKVAEFWSAALDIALDPDPSPYLATLNRNGSDLPRFMFLKVPEAKTAKNRWHLDLLVENSTPRSQEVARLVDLGATHVADKDEWGHSWSVLTDPEGNEFCVAARS
ncbi:MAG: VOC family protein [Geodermatophilaceae bacterium]|jgi:predicted enzyme related to lactoylglutathione lyase